MDENFESWNASLPDMEEELKAIRKNLQKRNRKIVLTSLVLAAVIFIGTFQFALPALEQQYPNPDRLTICKTAPDMALAVTAYSELFTPSQMVDYVHSTRTGFASYTLSFRVREYADPYDAQYLTATLNKGELTFPTQFWNYCSVNIFDRACYPYYPMSEDFIRSTREDLERLPDYILVEAAVSFSEDLSMESIDDLQESLDKGYIEWVGIRICEEDRQKYPLCGIKPYGGGIVMEDINDVYPYFDIKVQCDPEYFDDHFKTLLQFSLDQCREESYLNIHPQVDASYYEEILSYVEDSGVCSYGAYIVAPAGELLALMDNGIASQIWPQNAWIDF